MADKLPTSGSEPVAEPKATSGPAPRQGRKKTSLPSVDEILQQLLELNGAVAIGAISSKNASIMHKNLQTVLNVQIKRASREDAGPSQEALSELCKDDPRLLNALAPFLTVTQAEWLMKEVTDDPDEQV